MIDFNDTKTAFAYKSNNRLKRAYMVFQLIAIGWLNKLAIGSLQAALFLKLPVKGLIRATVFQQFCGGESIEDSEERIREIGSYNVKTILDYSAEGKDEESDFDATHQMLLRSIEKAKDDEFIPFSVFKTTGLISFGLLEKVNAKTELNSQEKEAFARGKQRVDDLCKRSSEVGIPVMIDAEESWIQDAIDEICLEMMRKYNSDKAIVYNTAQMYRHDRLDYIKSLHELSNKEGFKVGIKIVRGAYMEKERERAAEMGYPSPIQPDKAATDHDYDAAIAYCAENIEDISICAGTHNEKSSGYLADLMDKMKISHQDQRIFFSQLLGMSDHISFNLAKADYNVAKYVPYGPIKEVMPYLIRRAEENTSVQGQTGRELSLIQKELRRRRSES